MSDQYRTTIEELAIPHRAKTAFWRLMAAGRAALPAVRNGLQHESADVRQYCCRFLDHFVEPDSFDELIAMLDDGDPVVRMQALHALACDRCKTDTCPPDEAVVLPRAMALLRSDPDPHVRNHAIGANGCSVHSNPAAVAVLIDAVANASIGSQEGLLVCAGRPDLQTHHAEAGAREAQDRVSCRIHLPCGEVARAANG